MDLGVYRRRLGANNSSDALVNTTVSHIVSMFKESPFYKVIKINNQDKDVRLSVSNDREIDLLFMPNQGTTRGAIAEINGKSWMVVKVSGDELYPKAKIHLCNELIRWRDSQGILHKYPCVVKSSTSLDLKENTEYIKTAEGKYTVLIPYNSNSNSIELTDRFVLGGKTYEVIAIDNLTDVIDKTGYITLILEPTATSVNDDLEDGIAEDSQEPTSGWGGGW